MRYIDSIRRAGRSLGNAKGRTILTALAIAVGAFTITLALAAGTGIKYFVDDLLNSNINPDSISVSREIDYEAQVGGGDIKAYSETAPPESAASDITQYTVTQDQVEAVKALDQVESVRVIHQITPLYVALEGSSDKYSLNASSYDPGILLDEVAGELPPLGEPLPDESAVVSEDLANKLGTPDDVVGSTLTIRMVSPTTGEVKDFDLAIAAVAKPGAFSFVSGDLSLSEDAAQELYNFSTQNTEMFERYYNFIAVVEDGADPAQVATAIEKTDETLSAQTAKELSETIFQFISIAQYVVVGFGVIALVAAVFGIINTQYISVLGRTREIGLMKALGMRGRHVRRLFQLEAAWIGALGGVLGAFLAWLVGTTLLNPWLEDALELDGHDLLVFEIVPVVLLVVALIVIAMLAGYFPSRKAAKLDPIEALRTE